MGLIILRAARDSLCAVGPVKNNDSMGKVPATRRLTSFSKAEASLDSSSNRSTAVTKIEELSRKLELDFKALDSEKLKDGESLKASDK